ncbi:Transcription factor CP2-like 3-like protein [Cladobotryum mycophilum]|uniref:Transcription factor CP2-like 3-like protein n=1 Tax=Cladobotryum mycophilum TaxID=491253 RepID=A0ABR0SUC7_9HYPO
MRPESESVRATSAQKPADDLLADFRQQFPEVSTVSTEPTTTAISQTTATTENPILAAVNQERYALSFNPTFLSNCTPVVSPIPNSSLRAPWDSHLRRHTANSLFSSVCGIDLGYHRIHHAGAEAFRDLDPTPRATNDPWRFTPSLLDPSAFSPGGVGAMLPPPGLQTPGLTMTTGLESPMSVPTTADAIQPSIEIPELVGFRALEPHQMHHFNPFVHAPPPVPPPTVPFVPSNFVHHDTGYETMEQDGSPMESDPSEERIPAIASTLHTQQATGVQINRPLPPAAEKFRFHSTLNAPTAMVRHSDEIPVTYLNKGQAYSLSIVDTNGSAPIIPGTRYRTFVRISFEDEQQKQKPSMCWSLWKEGRGINEAHQRGGKLQAVEYVEAGQPPEGDDKRTRVELESSSFDGFSVLWTPGINGATEVSVSVRFNFLSTDFSHSKGVKGIPVRLCAKTNLLPSDSARPSSDSTPEVCFCKVKLFRDHGAERKLSNDVAHVKKSIDKVKQQIAQAENGHKDFKRKRLGGITKVVDAQRIAKTQKHKRTWSMSSASSAGGGPRMSLEEDLHFKLQSLQDMFTSTRPVSVLYLRGEEQDDPDLFPVALRDSLSTQDFLREGPNWQARSTHSSVTGSLVSPSPSSLSLASQASAVGSNAHWQNLDPAGQGDAQRRKLDQPTTINKTEDDGTLSGWIEALGVDPSYRPPPERSPKPVACFYIINHGKAEPGKREYHKAVYLSKRTLADLNERIAAKWGLETSNISRTIRATKSGIEVEVDDDMVQELKEGQDMELQVEELVEQAETKQEWDMVVDGADDKDDAASPTTSLVFRLIF